MTKARIEVHESSGNIFADLGLEHADVHYLKAQIVAELLRLSNDRTLTLADSGALMGITQLEASQLFRGDFGKYPVERLFEFLTAFECEAAILSKLRKKPGRED